MTGHVISHRAPHRKRRASGVWRSVEIIAGLLALAGAVWAERRAAPAVSSRPPLFAPTEARAPEPSMFAPLAAPEPAPAPASAHRRARRGEPSIPLDGRGEPVDDGFEILSAAELAAISQAQP
jgi:hypothetical protein